MNNFISKNPSLQNIWEKIGLKNHHGFAVPLFSIHTQQSCGIGEILDLIPLIDWMSTLKYDVIQLLPINDSGLDNSPYNPLTTCAINPVYLSLEKLPLLDKFPVLKQTLSPLKALTKQKKVDYFEVRRKKEEWIFTYLDQTEHLFLNNPIYQAYVKNHPFVTSYARFISLAHLNDWKHWKEWTKLEPDPFFMERQKMVQFLLFEQMKSVKEYAKKKEVFLMGDIPILFSSQSVDVWKNPSLFDLESSVGVPPDYFSEEGQAWGFPVMRWREKEDESFNLWKERLQYAENFYHIYRLDHIVGFFRLWVIQEGKKAKEGSYDPSDLSEATLRGQKILERLSSYTTMLPIGEDLGVVLPEFKEVMHSLGIPGMKVIRWERYWNTNREFIPLNEYPVCSLTCLSTHDTEVLEEWWNRHPEESALYAKLRDVEYAPMNFNLRLICLKDSHHTASLFHINLLNEYLALYPELVHDNPEEERVNTPGTPPEKNWQLRFRKNLETLSKHEELNRHLSSIIA